MLTGAREFACKMRARSLVHTLRYRRPSSVHEAFAASDAVAGRGLCYLRVGRVCMPGARFFARRGGSRAGSRPSKKRSDLISTLAFQLSHRREAVRCRFQFGHAIASNSFNGMEWTRLLPRAPRHHAFATRVTSRSRPKRQTHRPVHPVWRSWRWARRYTETSTTRRYESSQRRDRSSSRRLYREAGSRCSRW